MVLPFSLLSALLTLGVQLSYGGRPRVYNALISTSQELLPSRAYPAVSPIIGHPFYLASSGVDDFHKNLEGDKQQQRKSSYEYFQQEEDGDFDENEGYENEQFQGFEENHQHGVQEAIERKPQNTVRSQQGLLKLPEDVMTFRRQESITKQPQQYNIRPFENGHWTDHTTSVQRPVSKSDRPSWTKSNPPQFPSPRGNEPPQKPRLLPNDPALNNRPVNIPIVPPPRIPIRIN